MTGGQAPMPAPSPSALEAGRAFRLAMGFDPRSGVGGEHLARGTGSSLEFQDRRQYMPGDDVRHVDWRALARTNQLLVRQYREELLPHLDLCLDVSASMALDTRKQQLALDLTGALATAGLGQGFRVQVILLGERTERLDAGTYFGRGADFGSRRPLADCWREGSGLLKPGGLTILLSDFLSPHSPRELLAGLARGAGSVGFLQILGLEDREPPEDMALRLTDSENGEQLDLVLDAALRGRYLERLGRLIEGLRTECMRQGALHVELDAGVSLAQQLRGGLLRGGILAPA